MGQIKYLAKTRTQFCIHINFCFFVFWGKRLYFVSTSECINDRQQSLPINGVVQENAN